MASKKKLTVEIPAISDENTESGKLEKDGSDTSTQQMPFISGNGAHYTKYQRSGWMDIDEWPEYLRGDHSLTVLDDRIIT